MKKIKVHILKIEKWNRELEKINEQEIKNINETENIQQIAIKNQKPSTLYFHKDRLVIIIICVIFNY